MGKLIGKIIFGTLIFPPLYMAFRFLRWSWRSLEKEMQEAPKN